MPTSDTTRHRFYIVWSSIMQAYITFCPECGQVDWSEQRVNAFIGGHNHQTIARRQEARNIQDQWPHWQYSHRIHG